MKPKIIASSIALSLLLLFYTPFAHSLVMVPSVSLTVVVNTEGQDGLFNFDTDVLYGPEFSIQTQNLTGTQTQEVIFWGSSFSLTQQDAPGFEVASIECSSDNPANQFSYQLNSVVFSNVQLWSQITCVFNNTQTPTRNPVLIVPGLLGTEMKKGQEVLWADPFRMAISVSDSFMDPLQFNKDLLPMDNEVYSNDVIKNPNGLFDYTQSLITEFAGQGYVENELLFTFPYDWRYGVSGVYADGKTNPDLLKEKINEILIQTGANEVDVVAHSLGGLLVKKYAMDNPTDNKIGKAVFIGVPNTGAPKAVKALLTGDNFGVSFGPIGLDEAEMKKIAENLPVSYDLFPSQEYYLDNGSFVKTINVNVSELLFEENDLNYEQSKSFITNTHNKNSQGMANAQALHTNDFDNFDLRTAGVDLYSINGCKSGTISKLIETTKTNIFGFTSTTYNIQKLSTGDGTVPLSSAENLFADNDKIFYAKYPDHGKMPSQNGIRQQIVNIISGSSLDAGSKIITKSELDADPFACQLTGFFGVIMSPVSIEIIDQNKNRAGITEDQSIQNEIPGADYQIIGSHKFVYLPTSENQTYTINLKGQDTGTFTFKNSEIKNSKVLKTEVFIDMPATPSLIGQIHLSYSDTEPTTLLLDTDSDGVIDQTLKPSAVLSSEQSDDFIPPEITIISPEQKDYLRSDSFNVDYSVADNESGVFKSSAKLDNINVENQENIDLFFQTLGNHEFTVEAKDNVNNQSAVTVKFRVIVTIDSAISDIERAYSLGWIEKKSTKDNLIKKLNQAVKLITKIQTIEDRFSGKPNILKKIQKIEKKLDALLGKLMLQELALLKKTGRINQQAYDVISADINWLIENKQLVKAKFFLSKNRE